MLLKSVFFMGSCCCCSFRPLWCLHQGSVVFVDDLRYQEEHWDYCDGQDRRFHAERCSGLRPAGLGAAFTACASGSGGFSGLTLALPLQVSPSSAASTRRPPSPPAATTAGTGSTIPEPEWSPPTRANS